MLIWQELEVNTNSLSCSQTRPIICFCHSSENKPLGKRNIITIKATARKEESLQL